MMFFYIYIPCCFVAYTFVRAFVTVTFLLISFSTFHFFIHILCPHENIFSNWILFNVFRKRKDFFLENRRKEQKKKPRPSLGLKRLLNVLLEKYIYKRHDTCLFHPVYEMRNVASSSFCIEQVCGYAVGCVAKCP